MHKPRAKLHQLPATVDISDFNEMKDRSRKFKQLIPFLRQLARGQSNRRSSVNKWV